MPEQELRTIRPWQEPGPQKRVPEPLRILQIHPVRVLPRILRERVRENFQRGLRWPVRELQTFREPAPVLQRRVREPLQSLQTHPGPARLRIRREPAPESFQRDHHWPVRGNSQRDRREPERVFQRDWRQGLQRPERELQIHPVPEHQMPGQGQRQILPEQEPIRNHQILQGPGRGLQTYLCNKKKKKKNREWNGTIRYQEIIYSYCYLLPPKPPGAGAPNGAGAGAPNAGVVFAEEPNPPPEEPNGVLEPNMVLMDCYRALFEYLSL